jgi:hypothetical protein
VWVSEGVLIVFIASIEACEVLLNQEGERPEGSQADLFSDSNLTRNAPHVRLIGWQENRYFAVCVMHRRTLRQWFLL